MNVMSAASCNKHSFFTVNSPFYKPVIYYTLQLPGHISKKHARFDIIGFCFKVFTVYITMPSLCEI